MQLRKEGFKARRYVGINKAVHQWYLGGRGALSKEQKEELLKLRAQGLSWAEIEQELGHYREELRVQHNQFTDASGPRGAFTAEEDKQLLEVVEGWMRRFVKQQALDLSQPGTGASPTSATPALCCACSQSFARACESPEGARRPHRSRPPKVLPCLQVLTPMPPRKFRGPLCASRWANIGSASPI